MKIFFKFYVVMMLVCCSSMIVAMKKGSEEIKVLADQVENVRNLDQTEVDEQGLNKAQRELIERNAENDEQKKEKLHKLVQGKKIHTNPDGSQVLLEEDEAKSLELQGLFNHSMLTRRISKNFKTGLYESSLYKNNGTLWVDRGGLVPEMVSLADSSFPSEIVSLKTPEAKKQVSSSEVAVQLPSVEQVAEKQEAEPQLEKKESEEAKPKQEEEKSVELKQELQQDPQEAQESEFSRESEAKGEDVAEHPLSQVESMQVTQPTEAEETKISQDELQEQLYAAAAHGTNDEVKELLKQGANVHAKDTFGNTALHYAARYGHTDIMNTLMEGGADKDAQNKGFKQTPSHFAALGGQTQSINGLMHAGADVRAKDFAGEASLDYAAKSNNPELVNKLFKVDKDNLKKVKEQASDDQKDQALAKEYNRLKAILDKYQGDKKEEMLAELKKEYKKLRSYKQAFKESVLGTWFAKAFPDFSKWIGVGLAESEKKA